MKSDPTSLSSSELLDIFNKATVGMYRIRVDGCLIFANRALLDLLRIHKMELLSDRNIMEEGFFDGHRREEFCYSITHFGKVLGLEIVLTHLDGSQQFFRESAQASYDSKGDIAIVDGTLEDITEQKLWEKSIQASELKYSSLVEKGNDGIVIIQDGVLKFANKVIADLIGVNTDELQGANLLAYIAPENRKEVRQNYLDRLAGKPVLGKYNIELVKKNGDRLPVEINASAIEFEGRPGDMGIIRDITDRRKAEHTLQEFAGKIENLHAVVHELAACQNEEDVYRITVDAAERILLLTMSALDIYQDGHLVPKAVSKGFPTGVSYRMPIEDGIAGKTFRTGKTILTGNLQDLPEARNVSTEFNSVISATIGKIGVFQVCSTSRNAFSQNDARLVEILLGHTAEALKRLQLQEKLIEQAVRDPLTGVHNRYYLNQILNQEMHRSQRYSDPIGFIMIDVDRFKEINDRYGHLMGDKVLQGTAKFIQNRVRDCDIVVRYGGDEFLVILPKTELGVDRIMDRLMVRMILEFEGSDTLDFDVTLSMGSAHWDPKGSESIEDALAAADSMMYWNKREDRT